MFTALGILMVVLMVGWIARIYLAENTHLWGIERFAVWCISFFVWPVFMWILLKDEWTFESGLKALCIWVVCGGPASYCLTHGHSDYLLTVLVFSLASIAWFGIGFIITTLLKASSHRHPA